MRCKTNLIHISFYLASEVTLMNIRNARKVFEKLEKEGARN
jgi:hypothetical protein